MDVDQWLIGLYAPTKSRPWYVVTLTLPNDDPYGLPYKCAYHFFFSREALESLHKRLGNMLHNVKEGEPHFVNW